MSKPLFKMLLCFAAFCYCEWRDFKPSDYKNLIKSSSSTPLFLFTFSATCPHCRGLPEKFEEFGKSYKGNVIMSNINCSDRVIDKYCGKLGVRGYPTWFYIPSENRAFWRTDHRRTPQEWKVYLDILLSNWVQNGNTTREEKADRARNYHPDPVKSIVRSRDLDSPETDELTESDKRKIESSLKSGSPVLTVIESDEHSMDGVIESDVLIIKGRGSQDKITLHLSSHCKFEFDSPERANEFIASNSHYGHLHKFTYDEWKSVSDIAILFVQDKPNSTELEIVNLMSRELCGEFSVGWAPIGKSFKIMAEIMMGDQSQGFIGITKKDCVYLYRNNELKDESVKSFLQNVKSGTEKCLSRPEKRVREEMKMDLENPQREMKKKYGDRRTILIISPIVLLAVISVVLLQRRTIKKTE